MRNRGFLLLVLVGCSGSGVDGASPGRLTLDVQSLDFGAVEIGTTSVLALGLSNPGSSTIEVLSVSLVEGSSSLWTLDRNGVQGLAGGTSADLLVSFAPADTAPETGRVQIRSSDEESPSQFIAIMGSGALSTVDGDGDGFSPADGDCDDDNAAVNPGAEEICDQLDTDCDGFTPADEADDDFDGYPVCAGDCDDSLGEVYPGAIEICDGVDNDCLPGGDENDDNDLDGETPCDGDCDDADPSIYSGDEEVCDGFDNDCDGGIDDLDSDGDGHTRCSETGDCDDSDPNAYPVVVATNGNLYALGTDLDPYDSIATALANLDEVCHEIHLQPGSYEVDAEISGDFLTIYGGSAVDTTLTAPADERLLLISNNADVVLDGLTISGGNAATDGGAIKVETGASLTLSDVTAEGNLSATDGGAIAVASSTLILRNGCTFLNNTALDDGGAIALVSPVLFSDRGSVYVSNTAGNAGAVSVFGGTVDVSDQWFESNTTTLGDGGAMQISGGGSFLVERSHFQFNTSAAAGGALALTDIDDVDGWVRNLTAASNTAGMDGGAIAVNGSTAAIGIANNTLVGNTASGVEGGALHIGVRVAPDLQVRANLIGWSNASSGVFLIAGSTALVDYNTSYATSTLVEYGGALVEGVDENLSRDPLWVDFTDDGQPGNDNLDLQVGSFERDSGPVAATMNDPDGSRNDRGATGGPGANP